MSSGTINISRDLWDDEAFADEPFSEREAWIWMVAEASWKARKKRGVDLERGQLCHSVRFLAEAWGWSKSRVHRYLKRLEKRKMTRSKSGTASGTGKFVITLCKYDDYQSGRKISGTGRETRAGHERDKREEGERRGNKVDTDVSTHAFALFQQFSAKAGWPKPQRLSPARKKAILARLKDCGGLDGWEAALEKAAASDFISNSTWFGFEWMIKPANFTKLMEGNYDNRTSPTGGGNNPRGSNPHDGLMAGFSAYANSEPRGGGTDPDEMCQPVGPGEKDMDCGASGNPSEPILRLVSAGPDYA